MRNVTLALALLLLSLSPAASAKSTQAEIEAGKLLQTMKMQTTLQKTITQMVDVQLRQQPSLLPYKDVFLNYFSKYMSYESLKPELVRLYAETFTTGELKDINAFYKTPAGQKLIDKTPELTAKGAQIGITRVQEHMDELRKMIAEKAKSIETAQTKK